MRGHPLCTSVCRDSLDREEEMNATVEQLMELESEYGQCRWSEGSSGATFLDRMGEKRSREEAADLYQQIKAYAAKLSADGVEGKTK